MSTTIEAILTVTLLATVLTFIVYNSFTRNVKNVPDTNTQCLTTTVRHVHEGLANLIKDCEFHNPCTIVSVEQYKKNVAELIGVAETKHYLEKKGHAI